MPDIPTYSASRIKLYLSCRAQYYDRYVLGKKETRTDTSSIFGSALHNAIEYKYFAGAEPLARFQRYIQVVYARKNNQVELSHSITYPGMLNLGREILSTFPWERYDPKYLEYDFTVPFIFAGKTLANIHGYIDMITHDDMVVDFKSSKYRPKYLDTDIQFTLYWYAFTHLFRREPTHVFWHHLRDHSIVEYSMTQQGSKLAEITDTIEKMKTDTFDDVKNDHAICARCAPWCSRK